MGGVDFVDIKVQLNSIAQQVSDEINLVALAILYIMILVVVRIAVLTIGSGKKYLLIYLIRQF